MTEMEASTDEDRPVPIRRIFLEFLRLGLTSFGGPVAHIAYFRDRFVARLHWLDEAAFADLVALCQFLPGPASSQVGMGVGLEKGGVLGALAAFLGFTLPSAILMTALAIGVGAVGGGIDAGLIAGLGIVAVAVVAEAVRGMAMSLATGRLRAAIAIGATALALAFPGGLAQIGLLIGGGLIGLAFDRSVAQAGSDTRRHGPSRWFGAVALGLFVLLLFGLPAIAAWTHWSWLELAAAFYRSGSLVFGGGHVVLPLLRDAVVTPGFVSDASFIAGYGAAQAVPGPLFSVSSYLGAVAAIPSPLAGAALATLALFAPAFLLIVGALPFWRSIRAILAVRRALAGINAAVVGLLGAALYDPVFVTAIHGPRDLAAALLCYGMLTAGRVPAWVVVPLAGLAGFAAHQIGS